MTKFVFIPVGFPMHSSFQDLKISKPLLKWGLFSFLLLFVIYFILSVLAMEKYDCTTQSFPEEDRDLYKTTYGFSIMVNIFITISMLIIMGIYLKQSLGKSKHDGWFQKFLIFLTLIAILSCALVIAIPSIITTMFCVSVFAEEETKDEIKWPICNPRNPQEVNGKVAMIVLGSFIIFFVLIGMISTFQGQK